VLGATRHLSDCLQNIVVSHLVTFSFRLSGHRSPPQIDLIPRHHFRQEHEEVGRLHHQGGSRIKRFSSSSLQAESDSSSVVSSNICD
jgi:hypothetical protein